MVEKRQDIQELEKWHCEGIGCGHFDAENGICTSIPDLYDPMYCVPKMLDELDRLKSEVSILTSENDKIKEQKDYYHKVAKAVIGIRDTLLNNLEHNEDGSYTLLVDEDKVEDAEKVVGETKAFVDMLCGFVEKEE